MADAMTMPLRQCPLWPTSAVSDSAAEAIPFPDVVEAERVERMVRCALIARAPWPAQDTTHEHNTSPLDWPPGFETGDGHAT